MSVTCTAVLDRFEDDQAVLLLEEDDELVVKVTGLPEEAQHQNAVLTVTRDETEVIEFTYESEQTESRMDRAKRRFDRLSRRPPRTRAVKKGCLPPVSTSADIWFEG